MARPLSRLHEDVEDLHCVLDAFALGKTLELRGQRTRDTVSHALASIDLELHNVEQFRTQTSTPVRYVTPAAVSDVAQCKKSLASLRDRLNPILNAYADLNPAKRGFADLFLFLDRLSTALERLEKEINL